MDTDDGAIGVVFDSGLDRSNRTLSVADPGGGCGGCIPQQLFSTMLWMNKVFP